MADIVAACSANWPGHSGDCSGFCRAVAAAVSVPLQGLANQIVATIRGGGGWTILPDGPTGAAQAQEGNLVIGGLLGSEQASPSAHGHVVVVVPGGCASGKYPHAFWGMLGSVGAQNQTINYAWSASDRDRVTYAAYTTANVAAGQLPPPSTQAPAPPSQPAAGQTYPDYNQASSVLPNGTTQPAAHPLVEAVDQAAGALPPGPSTGLFDPQEVSAAAAAGSMEIGGSVVSVANVLKVGVGASGSFTTPTGQIVTVQNGIITNIY